MKTKEQVIKESYGEYWEELKELISDNGWVSFFDDKTRIRDIFHSQENISVSPNYNNNWRPKSLQGIENNKGWIKIESEEDLPKKAGNYKIVKSGKIEQATFIGNNRWFCDGRDFPNQTANHGITHWKNIEIEELPIH